MGTYLSYNLDELFVVVYHGRKNSNHFYKADIKVNNKIVISFYDDDEIELAFIVHKSYYENNNRWRTELEF